MDFDIYCDESRQEYFATPPPDARQRYVLIGGLWVVTGERDQLKREIRLHGLHCRRGHLMEDQT